MKHTLTIITALLLASGHAFGTDRFGGATAIKRQATGFFRVEQINGRWMFITPEGHGYLALGANHISKFMQSQSAPLLKRFGDDREKADAALTQTIRDLGLNAGEAYGPFWPKLQTQMPWVANVSYPQGAANFQFDVFDPKWQAKLRAHIVRECKAITGNPFVIGVAFVDQPEWGRKRLEYFRSLPEGAPGKKRLQEHQGTDEDFLGVIADAHYAQLKAAVREGAPKHLFLGERFVLRKAPDSVLKAVGKHVDVFCTQALILSRHRPPEWQTFQRDGWDHEFKLTGKPMLVIDWAAPFSLGEAFDSEHGRIKTEAEAAEDSAKWITHALAHPGIVGVFRCQLIGTHGNDRWFEGKAKRNYLRDDGTPFPIMAARVREANQAALKVAYDKAAAR
ncbi:MAG: hypothetical protein FJ395_20625 [Verrucomicrobia bacterium]|nr:hypothetical protein [Verrucomicrobiota bacterium]